MNEARASHAVRTMHSTEDLSDGELLRRYRQSGDCDAVDLLFQRIQPTIARLARRMRVPESDREDFVQEVFLCALVHADRFDDGRSFSAWVGGIAWRKVLEERRRFLQRGLPHDVLARNEPRSPLDEVERAEIRAVVARSVARLPAPYRHVVELYLLERHSAHEIALRVRRSPSTVRTQIARGLERLRDLLPFGLTPAMLLALRARSDSSTAAVPRRIDVRGFSVRALSCAAAFLLIWLVAPTPSNERSAATVERVASVVADRAPGSPDPAAVSSRSSVAREVVPHADAKTARATSQEPARASAADVRLRFVDAKTQVPIPDFVFACQPWRDASWPDTRWPDTGWTDALAFVRGLRGGAADEHGEAILTDFPQGPMRVRFSPATGSRVYDVRGSSDFVVPVDHSLSIGGFVRDVTGAAVDGAEIWIDEVVHGSFVRELVVARSSSDGSFHLAVAPSSPKKIWARVPNRARARCEIVSLVPRPTDAVRLTLEPASAAVIGRLVRADGTPEPEALVTLVEAATTLPKRAVLRVDTGADGTFAFDTLPERARCTLLAVAADGSTTRATVDASSDPRAQCELVLAPRTKVRGRIQGTAERERLVAAAVPLGAEPSTSESWRVRACDADGRFELDGVEPGRVELFLIDAQSAEIVAREAVEIRAGEEREWNAVRACGGTVDQSHGLRRLLAWLRDPAVPHGPALTRSSVVVDR